MEGWRSGTPTKPQTWWTIQITPIDFSSYFYSDVSNIIYSFSRKYFCSFYTKITKFALIYEHFSHKIITINKFYLASTIKLYIYIYIFEYVGKMSSFKQVLLNSKLHFCLINLAETFSNSQTDFRRSDGRLKIRDPKETTDMTNHPNNTNWNFLILLFRRFLYHIFIFKEVFLFILY